MERVFQECLTYDGEVVSQKNICVCVYRTFLWFVQHSKIMKGTKDDIPNVLGPGVVFLHERCSSSLDLHFSKAGNFMPA